MKRDRKNPGPSDTQFTKQKNVNASRGKVASSKGGSAGADQQFNKGQSYNDDDGSSAAAGPQASGPKISSVGSANVADQQFTNAVAKSGKGGKVKSNTPGDDMNFNGQDISPAKMIMRAVGKAANSPAKTQKAAPQNKPKAAKSPKGQAKNYQATTPEEEQARPKSQLQQKIKVKKPESSQ